MTLEPAPIVAERISCGPRVSANPFPKPRNPSDAFDLGQWLFTEWPIRS